MPDQSKFFVLATANKNKLSEIRGVAEEYGYSILSPKEVEEKYSLAPFPDPLETGSTYQENAFIKAQACYDWCKLPSIGDDSGLEVKILDNAPGLYSARYAGVGASDLQKIEKLLSNVAKAKLEKNSMDTSALFRCVLCLVTSEVQSSYFEGILEGEVLNSPQGERGFGYDPIIHITELNRTLSEISFEELLKYGFRGKALRKLISTIENN